MQIAALSYREPQTSRLLYKLEGFDDQWRQCTPGSATITYSKIPYGKYSFRVRLPAGSDHAGPEAEKRLFIEGSPPFYLSAAAYVVYGLLALGALVLIWIYYTRRNVRRQQQHIQAFEREKERELYNAKISFFTNIAHEIRTPLNAIVGFSSLMQSEELSQEERAEYCDIVVNNSEMLLTLLNDILDISSLECGKIRFNYASEEIVQICQHALMTTAHTRQEGVKGRFECAVDSFMLTTDAHRLSQILINLLTNAGKFTSEGSITLGVEIDKEHGEVLFSVTDTGPGIPPDKQEMVFNRFEKLEGNKKKGTGLGLAICRQIAVIIGGRIWVDPTYTGGARFIFAHPLAIGTGRKGRKGK